MTIDQARTIVSDPRTSADHAAVCEAASVLASSRASELSDLIRCLRLGGHPAEIASTALYTRTGRPVPPTSTELSVDADEWLRYLDRQLSLARAS